jgi:hypothetical protein
MNHNNPEQNDPIINNSFNANKPRKIQSSTNNNARIVIQDVDDYSEPLVELLPVSKRLKIVAQFDSNRDEDNAHDFIPRIIDENQRLKSECKELRNKISNQCRKTGKVSDSCLDLITIKDDLKKKVISSEGQLSHMKLINTQFEKKIQNRSKKIAQLKVRLQIINDAIANQQINEEQSLKALEVMSDSIDSTMLKSHNCKDEIQRCRLRDQQRLCKVCGKEETCTVSVPCFHLYGCEKCGPEYYAKSKICPNCKEIVTKTTRLFFA